MGGPRQNGGGVGGEGEGAPVNPQPVASWLARCPQSEMEWAEPKSVGGASNGEAGPGERAGVRRD